MTYKEIREKCGFNPSVFRLKTDCQAFNTYGPYVGGKIGGPITDNSTRLDGTNKPIVGFHLITTEEISLAFAISKEIESKLRSEGILLTDIESIKTPFLFNRIG